MIKKILIALLLALVIIQFFRPAKNLSPQKGAAANNIALTYAVPDDVNAVMKQACYDCHSNNTRYPWYSNIQPVAWWLDNHVREGKRELNFDDFTTYRPRRQFHKMEEVEEQVKEGEMPLWSYTLLHKNARLTPAQKQLIVDWAVRVRTTMKGIYPPDSLIQNK